MLLVELPLVAVLFIAINNYSNNEEFRTGWQSLLIAILYLSPEQLVRISVSCHKHRCLLLPPPNHQQSTSLPKTHANDATYNSSRHWIAIIAFRQVWNKCRPVIPLTDCGPGGNVILRTGHSLWMGAGANRGRALSSFCFDAEIWSIIILKKERT